jgi:hypothetical protein
MQFSMTLTIFIIVLATVIKTVTGFANMMAIDYYCSKELTPGTIIMNQEVADDISVTIRAQSYATQEQDSAQYLETLTFTSAQRIVLSIDPIVSQVIFEIVPSVTESCQAHFDDGQCKDKYRSIEQRPVLIMPENTDCIVSVFAAWAKSFKAGVKRTPILTFKNDGDSTDL